MSHYTETTYPAGIVIDRDDRDYGYALIKEVSDGTWTVLRCVWRSGWSGEAASPRAGRHFPQEETLGITSVEEAREVARSYADWLPAPAARRTQHCHWCGLPTRRGYCEECGEQF